MNYITGLHALNLECPLNTSGDWHMSALRWQNLTIADTENMFFGTYGLTKGVTIPEHIGPYIVANHIRALLDLLQWGNFAVAQGMNHEFICNSDYDDEVFEKVWTMKGFPNWDLINKFMGKECGMKWVRFYRRKEAGI